MLSCIRNDLCEERFASLLHLLPPSTKLLILVVQVEQLADHRCRNVYVRHSIQFRQLYKRLIPWMLPEFKLGRMYWKEPTCFQILTGFQNLVGKCMNIAPCFVILTILKDGQVEIAEFSTKFSEVRIIAAVTAQKNSFRWTFQYVRRPQRRISFQRAP